METAQEIRDFVRTGKKLPDHFDMKHAYAAAKAYSGIPSNRVIGMDVKLHSTSQGDVEGVNYTMGREKALALGDQWRQAGYHVISMRDDFRTIYGDGTRFIQPATAEAYCDRSWDFPYKIDHDDLCFRLFTAAGFEWGGDWTTRKDYQHFELVE